VGMQWVEDQPPPLGVGFRPAWAGWAETRRRRRRRNLEAIQRVASARRPVAQLDVVQGQDSKEPAGIGVPTGSTTFDSVGSLGGCISQSTR
jgi:hypothetical protein